MRVVYKYQIVDGKKTMMPKGAVICHVGCQGFATYAWALVDEGAPMEERDIRLFGTGQSLGPDRLLFLGTGFMAKLASKGMFVWHFFECVPEVEGTSS